MRRAWLGVLLLAGWGVLLWPLLRRAAGVRGLTARVAGYPEMVADGRVGLRFEGATGRARPTLDGVVADRPGTDASPRLTPGLHTVGLDVVRRRRTAEQVHATVLAGPFAEGGWARCAARVGLSQRLLDLRIEPLVAELTRQALGDVEDLPGVSKSTVNLRWTARGMDVDLAVRFVDKTELTVSSKLAMTVAGDRVLLSRISAVSARIKGPLVDQALDAYVPGAIKKYAPWSLTVLHKVTGKAVRWYAQRVAQREASSAIDLELLPAALGILRLPPPIPLPGAEGARLELRFCGSGGLRLEPGQRATVAFDLRVVIPSPPVSSLGAPGPVLARGAPVRPPASRPGADSELTIEVSLDALNAALEGAWRAGVLGQALQDPALAARLDRDLDPLDFRPRDLGVPLPPVLTALAPRDGGATLSIAAELAARLAPLRGSARGRDARLFARGSLAVTLSPDELRVSALPTDVRLTCRAADRARPGGLVLSACYADLMTLITVALKTPGQGGLDDLALPLEAVVPAAPPTSPIDWTVERLALSAPDPAWLRLDARASFRAR
ncbi:MAG: hypothetical protein IT370_24585 [Deltaproteobacteria bacterium]|nr:hypothetical protein [Deltaproteobacteria bacterium]